MQYHEVELTVGDVLHLGDTMVVVVVDIEGEEITFRLDDPEAYDDDQANGQIDYSIGPLPR